MIQSALALDHAGIVEIVMQELDRNETMFNRSRLVNELREGRVSSTIMRKLANSERPDLRQDESPIRPSCERATGRCCQEHSKSNLFYTPIPPG